MGCLDVSNLRILFLEKAFKIYLGFIKVSQPITGGLGWATAEGGLRSGGGSSCCLSPFPVSLMGRSALKRKTKTRQQQNNNKKQQNKPRVGKPSIQFSIIFYIRGHCGQKSSVKCDC